MVNYEVNIYERLELVRKHNEELIGYNSWEDKSQLSTKQVQDKLELEWWFHELQSDLYRLGQKRASILVDRIVCGYSPEFVAHRYKVSERYIRMVMNEERTSAILGNGML